jgi:hypothetical protein
VTARTVAAVVAALAAAAALAWLGAALLALPAHESAVASSIVGGRDARRFDEAVRLFRSSVGRPIASDAAFARRAHAEKALAAQEGGAQLRARAQTLVGVLVAADAGRRRKGAGDLLAAAAASFRTALRLAPDDEDAAADLELLLASRKQQQAATRPPAPRRPGGGLGHGKRASRGATASTSTTRGY